MNSSGTSYHQLGKFIYVFQVIESQIDGLMILMANADDEMTSILISELDFFQKVKTADVMYARFVDVRRHIDPEHKRKFHKCMNSIQSLCERRNDLVHSRYYDWMDVEGKVGLLRQNSKLRSSKGHREEIEEELLPEAFTKDLAHAYKISIELDGHRRQVIEWRHPD